MHSKPLRALPLRLAWIPGAALAAAVALTPAAGQSRGFGEVTEVTAVEIPVQVIRDGQAVRGLTAKDFEVYDGRARQTIAGFDAVDLTTTSVAAPSGAPAPPAPLAALRHFLVLFDLAYSEPKAIVKGREAVRQALLKNLAPSDLVAVATYSANSGPALILGFTSDRSQIEAAINHLGLPKLVDRSPDPLRLVADSQKAVVDSGTGMSERRAGVEQAVLENLQTLSQVNERANRDIQIANVSAFTRSFTDLAKVMASVAGRKQVIYLSEGFDSALLQGTADVAEQNQMAEDAMAGETWKVDSEKRYGNTRRNNELEKMMEQFRRSDCVIQAVDIGGLRAPGDLNPTRASGEAALFQMAHDTGGELYHNFNDLGAAMGQMLQKTSVTYVLTIQPEALKRDGTYHKLRVELKNAARGTRVVYRQGFYAPRPYLQHSGMEKILTAGNQVMGGESSGSIDIAVLAAPFRTAAEKAYVPVLIETNGASLLGVPVAAAGAAATVKTAGPGGAAAGGAAPDAGGKVPAEIFAYALDSQGAVRDFFNQTLGLDLAKMGPALRQSGLKFFGHLELPAGDYTLRVLVRNGSSGAYGMRLMALSVPAFGGASPVLLPPFFPEQPNRWLIVREAPRGEQRNAAYPFMAGEKAYVPASRPLLPPAQAAAVSLVGWNWGAGELRAEAHVIARDGRDMGAGELRLGAREAGGGTQPDRIQAVFRPPQGLAPGDYQLVVKLTTPAGSGTSSAAFAVPASATGST